MIVPVLAGDSITLDLGGRRILEAAYVDAVPGTITALVGRSGVGKTTLFSVLAGRRRPDQGHVRWRGERVDRPSLRMLGRRGLVFHPDRPEALSTFGLMRLSDRRSKRRSASRADAMTSRRCSRVSE